MKRVNISSGSPYEPEIGFSRAVRTGNLITVSGTAPIGDDGKTVSPGDLYRQTLRCLQIIEKALRDAGGRLEHVIRTRVYLKDASLWKEAAKAHGEYFSDIRPASTFVEVKGFVDEEWLVEIEADCLTGEL